VDGPAILDTPLDQTMAIARTQNATMDALLERVEGVTIADAAVVVVVGIRIRQGKPQTREASSDELH
jgi:hypothetical protein